MAYKYNGKLTGDKDPWQQPVTQSATEPERIRGLYYDKRHDTWNARIVYKGKARHLGSFKDQAKAIAAITEARTELQRTDPLWPDHAPRPHRKNKAA